MRQRRFNRAGRRARLLATTCLVLGLTATNAYGWTAAQQATHEEYLTSVGAVAGGCAANPGASGCPDVSTVVYLPSIVEGSDETGYAPLLDPLSTQSSTAAATNQCGVSATRPERYVNIRSSYAIRGRASNQCFQVPTRPVVYQEVYASLERQYLGGGWQNLDTKSARRFGPGIVTTPYAFWDCNHIELRLYRVNALGYSVVGPTGFIGVNRKYEDWTCHDL